MNSKRNKNKNKKCNCTKHLWLLSRLQENASFYTSFLSTRLMHCPQPVTILYLLQLLRVTDSNVTQVIMQRTFGHISYCTRARRRRRQETLTYLATRKTMSTLTRRHGNLSLRMS